MITLNPIEVVLLGDRLRKKKEDTMLRDEVTLSFENTGDVILMHPDYPDQLIARVDSEGDIHTEDDVPGFVNHNFIMDWLEHTLSMTLELGDIDWTPDTCFLRAAGWDIDWTWDDASRSWVRE